MNILIVKLSSIGDVIHTLPVLAELRRHFPSGRIAWVVERASAQLLRGNPMLDHLVEIDTLSWRQRWWATETLRQIGRAIRELRAGDFDLGFDFQGLLKSSLVLRLSGARRRFGFETVALREKQSLLFLTQQVPVSDDVHVIEKNLELIRAVGIRTAGEYEFPISISTDEQRAVDLRLNSLGVERFVLMNPGGHWKGKRWSPEAYAAICDYLWEVHGLVTLVTHAPGDEASLGQLIGASRSSPIPFGCTLKQLAVLADRAELFLGGDTGPLHLAAARGTPIVAIFGPTSARRNGPFSAADIVVQDPQVDASPYYHPRLHEGQYIRVSVEQVKQAIERRLARASESRSHNQGPRANRAVG